MSEAVAPKQAEIGVVHDTNRRLTFNDEAVVKSELARLNLPVDFLAVLKYWAAGIIEEFPDLKVKTMEDDAVVEALADLASLNDYELTPEQWRFVKGYIIEKTDDDQWISANIGRVPQSEDD